MTRKLFRALLAVILMILLGHASPVDARMPRQSATSPVSEDSSPSPVEPQRPASRAIGAIPASGPHLVRPRPENVERWLYKQKVISLNATSEQVEEAVAEYYRRFAKRSRAWISPQIQEWQLKREATLDAASLHSQATQKVTAAVLALAVEFGATETFTLPVLVDGECVVQTVTISGPRKGNIPRPGPRDNNTVWYSPTLTADAKFYEKLIFGYEGVGRVRYDLRDPLDGRPGINLAGYTVQDYYDHVAGKGNVYITGTVEGWITVPHSEGYYGANDCETGNDGGAGVPVGQLVVDALKAFNEMHPSYYTDTSPNAFWPRYDANRDGVLDSLWIIHAGMGEEAGGGAEGSFAIWSHSWDLRAFREWAENGYKVYEGDPNTAEDDIYVQSYTIQPENADLGVLVEEFGHNFFGLPDLYTTDAQNSIAFWSIMEAGAWAGPLGGAAPVGMPLWFRMLAVCGFDDLGHPIPCNWQEPMVIRNYNDPLADIVIGQLEQTPPRVHKGVRINLPPVSEEIPNPVGAGQCAWSGTGRNYVDITLDRELIIPPKAAGLLTIPSSWAIEEDYDYGYVMLKDGGADWVFLDDLDGILTEDDPNGTNLGHGLTGKGKETLRFDLSAYAGKVVTLRLRYRTDAAVTEAGWWVDDIRLDGVLVDDFEAARPPSAFPGWTNSEPGWLVAPTTRSYPNYYLVEWRSATKYDRMVRTAYVTTYADEDEWQVQRVPYNIPGALLYYRNAKYSSTYTLLPSLYDPPSIGPKYQLLVVDMNPSPLRLGDTGPYSTTVLSARAGSYDAALTLQPSEAFTLTGAFVGGQTLKGIWSFPAKPAVNVFEDLKGYYAGFYHGTSCDPGHVCFSDRAGSAVIPARGIYSTRVTTFGGRPLYELYGEIVAGFPLGSGNPGDDNVQHGVQIRLLNKSSDNSRALLRFSNQSVDIVTNYERELSLILPSTYTITYRTTVANVGTETARQVVLTYTLDSSLNLVQMASEGPIGAVDSAKRTWTAPQLLPGQAATVTVVCTGTASSPQLVRSVLSAHDGSARGPWLLNTKVSSFRIWLPLLLGAPSSAPSYTE